MIVTNKGEQQVIEILFDIAKTASGQVRLRSQGDDVINIVGDDLEHALERIPPLLQSYYRSSLGGLTPEIVYTDPSGRQLSPREISEISVGHILRALISRPKMRTAGV